MRSAVLVGVVCLAGCSAMEGLPRPALMASYDWGGLEPVEMRGIDYAAMSPTTDFGRYQRVVVDPVTVSFDEKWEPLRTGTRFEPTETDLARLGEELGEAVRESFADEIRDAERYELVDVAAPGALRVHAVLVDVRLNAPDLPTPTRIEQFARSAGEWTLVAELIDTESGAVVGRLVDRWVDPEDRYMQRMTRVENLHAMRRAADAWARAVHRYLEVAAIRNRMEGVGEGLRSVGGS